MHLENLNKKRIQPILIVLLTACTLSAQNVTLDNGIARMNISLSGGVITELKLKSIDLNTMHDYGHFLAFDRWGPSSQEDQDLGIPFHGNASKVYWTLLQEPIIDDGMYHAEMTVLLPVVKLRMNRKIFMNQYSSVIKVVEEISNHTDSTKVFNVVQHPTIGAPFLDEFTIVDTRVDSGFSQAGNLPPQSEDVIYWPEAVVDGDSTDLRFLATDHSWNSAVVTFILNNEQEYGWVTAVNPSLNLMLGYIWPTDDYPWLNLWMNIRNSEPFARGLEFGSTGLHQAWPDLLEMDTIFGKKLYEEIESDEIIEKSYYTFLSEIPSDYQGVSSVTKSGDTIVVDEYGLAPERRIKLDIIGSPPDNTSIEYQEASPISLLQNYPNPFHPETSIAFNMSDMSHVQIEVFNTLGQRITTLVDTRKEPGNHTVTFNATGLPDGIYYYSFKAEGIQLQKKMILKK